MALLFLQLRQQLAAAIDGAAALLLQIIVASCTQRSALRLQPCDASVSTQTPSPLLPPPSFTKLLPPPLSHFRV
ncbi:hypothetical protein CISIN_1g047729mg [Citrus sinensis]|uniref:Uncharacterized protein n=1 Tax=Citrus sinensis TaxID=2711 RepID=A0A067E9U8_CITSI|nr:hypothetical protein CISIN_1g047729mg [Citrus sinensis]